MTRLALICLVAFLAACSAHDAKPAPSPAPVVATGSAAAAVDKQAAALDKQTTTLDDQVKALDKQAKDLLATVSSKQPRNLVCERLALENSKAPCVPELTDAGELHTHTARITVDGQTIVCALNSQQVSVVCGPMFMAAQKQPEPQPAPADAKVAPKAGAKK